MTKGGSDFLHCNFGHVQNMFLF